MKNSRFIDDPGVIAFNPGDPKQALLDKIVRLKDMKKYAKALAAFNAGDLEGARMILSEK